jgi:hypothetical protein
MKKNGFWIAAIAACGLVVHTGCRKEGPGEKAGEKIDHASDKVKDAVTPDGPAEKAGKKIDKAGRDVKKKAD